MTATADALRYLATQTGWLAHHPEAVQAFDELEHICALVDTSIDTQPPQVYAGPCDVCRRDMYAAEDAEAVVCHLCDMTYDMDARRAWLLEAMEDRLERSTVVARAVSVYGTPIDRKRIDNWHSRGLLVPHGQDREGRPLYRVGDVLRLVHQMPQSRGHRAVGDG